MANTNKLEDELWYLDLRGALGGNIPTTTTDRVMAQVVGLTVSDCTALLTSPSRAYDPKKPYSLPDS